MRVDLAQRFPADDLERRQRTRIAAAAEPRRDADTDRDVVVKVALSYTGLDGARKNLAAETGDSYDFDATRAALRDTWIKELDRIEIGGGTDERRSAFYTALYHSLLHPNLAGDVDGSYVGFDRRTHTADGYTP